MSSADPTDPLAAPVVPPRGRRGLRALRAVSRWSWPYAIVVAVVFLAQYVWYVVRATAFPYYDSIGYLDKVWAMADRFAGASGIARLQPSLYLSAPPENYGLLMPAIAAVFAGGGHASPQAVALVWAVTRVLVVVLAVALLSWELRTSLFVPAALLVIFASPVTDNFTRMYMLDEPFGAFGLLAFVLVIIDDRRGTIGSAAAAAAGMLALFMVKPVAPAFLLPLVAVRGVRALLPLFRADGRTRATVGRFAGWCVPYLVLAGAFWWLYFDSPYGPAIREQYRLGQAGYWHVEVGPQLAWRLMSFLLPPWVALALLAALPFARRRRHKAILGYALVLFAWWAVFLFFLTYTVEDRLIGQAMPAVVVGVMVFLCSRPVPAFAVTTVATVFFAYNTLAAGGHEPVRPGRPVATAVRLFSPVPGVSRPVREVGLIAAAKQLLAAIPPPPAGAGPTDVLGLFGDNYAEPNSVDLALRAVTGEKSPRVDVGWVDADPSDLSVGKFVAGDRWFLTKTHRRHPPSYEGSGIWTTMDSYHAVVTDPDSPLHPYFHQRFEAPLRLPFGNDTLVLWELPQRPPTDTVVATLKWLRPRLAADPRAATAVDKELAALAASAH